EAFDARLEFHECPVIGHVDHAADDAGIDRITLNHGFPGIGFELLEAEGHALLAAIELQHAHRDFLPHLEHLRRMRDAAIGHVRDVQQAVDTAKVDERAVLGKIFYDPGDHRAFHEMLQGGVLPDIQLFLNGHFPRDDDVAAPAVELDDL